MKHNTSSSRTQYPPRARLSLVSADSYFFCMRTNVKPANLYCVLLPTGRHVEGEASVGGTWRVKEESVVGTWLGCREASVP